MIPVQITQTQEENDNPTMAFPFLDDFLVPEMPVIPERQLTQTTLKFNKKSVPTHEYRQVREHVRADSTLVKAHMRKVNAKERTGKAKHGAFPRMTDNYKHRGDVQVARGLYLEQRLELSRGSKK